MANTVIRLGYIDISTGGGGGGGYEAYPSILDFPPVGSDGVIYLASDSNKIYKWSGVAYVEISSAPVTSVNTEVGDVVLDKTDIGLGDVDNTSDADKPISTATATALSGKVSTSGDTMNGQLTMLDTSILINGTVTAGIPLTTSVEAGLVYSNSVDGNITSSSELSLSSITIDRTDANSTTFNKNISLNTGNTASIISASINDFINNVDTTITFNDTLLYYEKIDNNTSISANGVFGAGVLDIYTTQADGSYVDIYGDTTGIAMTSFDGAITSPLLPTLPEHVVVKKYVDDADALKVNRSDTDNATEVWVSPSGNNSQLNVGSQFYPYATIQQAFNDIPDATSIQQWANERIVIHLKTGEYNESPILFYKRRSVTVVGHGAKLLQDITINYDPKNQYPGFTYTQASLPAPWTNGFASPTLSLCCENDANGMESGFTTDAMMFLGAIKFIIANYATQATPNYGTSYVTMNGVEARGGFQVLDAGASSNGSVTLEVMTSVINGANIGLTRAGGAGSGFTLKATDSRITSDIGPRIVINKLESCRLGKLDRTYGGYTEGAIKFTNTTATTGITNCTFVGTGTQYIGNTTGTANSTIKLDLATWYQLRALTLDYGTGCLFNIMDSSKLVRVVAAEAGSTTMTNVTDHLFLDPVSTRTAYTVTMKPNPVDGDEVQVSSGAFGITTLTLLGNTGQTINGAITGLPANSWAKYRWNLATTRWIFSGSYLSSIQADINSKIPLAEKGAPNGVAPLNSVSKIDATYLPSYVDDVLEFANLAAFPVTGSTGIIYVALDTNLIYRWSGSAYVEISPSAAITWGSITGTLSTQTDLQNALNAKFDDPIGTTAQYIRGDGTLATFPTIINQASSLVTTVFNKSGAPITKFSVVYINGGQGDMPTIALAQGNNESNSSKTFGVVYEDIPNMQSGQVIVAGALTGLNTDQFNPTAPTGDVNGVALYLSPTVPGGVTTTKPSAPNHMVYIATIVRTHQTQGVVEVRIQNGFELGELHNVQALNGTVLNNQVLKYDLSTNLWKNQYIGLASDIEQTPFSVANNQSSAANITGLAFSNASVRSFSVVASVSIDATSDLFELVKIDGIQKGSEWDISVSSVGDNTQIMFSITNAGQIQYTSPDYAGFVSGVIKFRAITTSI